MNWIKMRASLETDGRVRIVSGRLSAKCPHVLGQLFRFWCLADKHANADGVLFGWNAEAIDEYLGESGFCQALPEDWIDLSGEWVKLPEYQEHNGETAKKRAQDAKRKRIERSKNKRTNVQEMSQAQADSTSLLSSPLNRSTKRQGVPASPLYAGCQFLRLSDEELTRASKRFEADGHPPKMLKCAIDDLENWLATAPSQAALRARENPSHYPLLFSSHTLEGAQRRLKALRNGAAPTEPPPRPNHGAYRIFNPEEHGIATQTLEQVGLKPKTIEGK